MSLNNLKREAEEIVELKSIVNKYTFSENVGRIVEHMMKHHFIRDHIQDLSYSLLELKVAVFRKEYRLIGRLVRKFTKLEHASIHEIKGEIEDFRRLVVDVQKNGGSRDFVEELEKLLNLYSHLITEIDTLFAEVHGELEGSTEEFEEGARISQYST